jgi:hypothetical protein
MVNLTQTITHEDECKHNVEVTTLYESSSILPHLVETQGTILYGVQWCFVSHWWLSSSGRWRRVALIRTDVSEDRIASIFRVNECFSCSPYNISVETAQKTPYLCFCFHCCICVSWDAPVIASQLLPSSDCLSNGCCIIARLIVIA